MFDLAVTWAGDLQIGPTGDLAVIDGPGSGQLRVIRRLLTNQGDYIWQPEYGAGLAQFVGSPAQLPRIEAIVRRQLLSEPCVAPVPEPTVTLSQLMDGILNDTYLSISYVDAESGQTQKITPPTGQ